VSIGWVAVVIRYLRELNPPRIILWCYLIWYLVVLVLHFEPSPVLWLNSLGISAIIGTGLVLSTAYAGRSRTALDRWQTFRLYLMPFCVSSFAALIKGRGFVLVFHPTLFGNALAFGSVAGFLLLALGARATGRGFSTPPQTSEPRPAGGPVPAERGRT
jgi:hypothetical protein